MLVSGLLILANVNSSSRLRLQLQMAIEHGIQYDKCQLETGSKLACILDKALSNVGSIFAEQVEGRVSTEVDPRDAYDTGEQICYKTASIRTSLHTMPWDSDMYTACRETCETGT